MDARVRPLTRRIHMIQTEAISPRVLKIVPTEKLKEVDFDALAPQVDAMIAKFAGKSGC
jgi:hypothetical protein